MKVDAESNLEQAKQSARRRLLRGGALVPVVTTLTSGSAFAASSTLRCFRNAPTGIAVTTVPDNIWRVRRYETRLGFVTLRVFAGSDIKSVESANGGQLIASRFAATKWYRADNGQETLVGSGAGAPKADGGLLALRLVSNDDPLAPRFQIVGVATGPYPVGPGQIMSMSCWGSVF